MSKTRKDLKPQEHERDNESLAQRRRRDDKQKFKVLLEAEEDLDDELEEWFDRFEPIRKKRT